MFHRRHFEIVEDILAHLGATVAHFGAILGHLDNVKEVMADLGRSRNREGEIGPR